MEPDDLTHFTLPEPTPTTTAPSTHLRQLHTPIFSLPLCHSPHPPHPHHHPNHNPPPLSQAPAPPQPPLHRPHPHQISPQHHHLISRRLRPGLDSLPSLPPTKSPRAIYLFPPTHSHSSINISDFNSLYPLSNRDENLVLIVFDGTWKHAKEMVSSSLGFLSKFAIRVCLNCDERESGGSIYDSELILRKEPFGGCVSTMEAVARALRVIEPNGVEIERRLVDVLREMVRFQKNYLKPMKPRPKLLKKGKKKEEGEEEKNGSSELSGFCL